MVFQFGSLGYTIMRKTVELAVVQKTIIDTLHKEGKPQTFIHAEMFARQPEIHAVNIGLSGWKKRQRRVSSAKQ